jgi:hypothetical protein
MHWDPETNHWNSLLYREPPQNQYHINQIETKSGYRRPATDVYIESENKNTTTLDEAIEVDLVCMDNILCAWIYSDTDSMLPETLCFWADIMVANWETFWCWERKEEDNCKGEGRKGAIDRETEEMEG